MRQTPARERLRKSTMLNPELVALTRCPRTGSALDIMNETDLAKWNCRIKNGEIDSLTGVTVREPMDQALLNAERSLIVPVRQGIVIMLESELIPTDRNDR